MRLFGYIFNKVFNKKSIEEVFYNMLTHKEQNRVIALHLIGKKLKEVGYASRDQVLSELFKIGLYKLDPLFSSTIDGDFKFLTGSSWNELLDIASRYNYHSYHRFLQLLN